MTTILTPKIAQPLRCPKVTIFHDQVLQVLFWQALPYKENPVRLGSARETLETAKSARIGIVTWNSKQYFFIEDFFFHPLHHFRSTLSIEIFTEFGKE